MAIAFITDSSAIAFYLTKLKILRVDFRKLGRGGIEARLPDGRGVRFNKDGSLSKIKTDIPQIFF